MTAIKVTPTLNPCELQRQPCGGLTPQPLNVKCQAEALGPIMN